MINQNLSGKEKPLLLDHCWEKSECILSLEFICTKALISARGVLQTGSTGAVCGFVVILKSLLLLQKKSKTSQGPLCATIFGQMMVLCTLHVNTRNLFLGDQ